MYNTYITIGSVSDGHVKKVYDEKMATTILDEQVGIIETMIKSMKSLVDKKMLKNKDDITYANECIDILEGLKKQASHFINYIKTNNKSKATEFDNQRKSNWAKISEIMGFENKNDD